MESMLLYSAYRESLAGLPSCFPLAALISLAFQFNQPTARIAAGIFVLMNTVLASPPTCCQPHGRPRYILFAAGPLAFAAPCGSMTALFLTLLAVIVLFKNTMP